MMRTTTTLLLAIVLLASCNQYQKTSTGLAYKITKGSSTVKLKNGDLVKFHVEYKLPPKDSLLSSSFGHIPGYLRIDTSRIAKHSFLEIITLCSVGDKIDFVLSVDTLKKLGMIEYNSMFHPRDMIKGKVEILKAFANELEANADVMKEVDAEKARELKDLQAYVAKKGVKTQSTLSGVLVEVQNAGDAQKADSGKQTKILYRGSLLSGKQFDTNMDKNGPHNQPLDVTIGLGGGQGSVIKGMDEGLRLFGKGGKGRIYIPAMLAYGQSGQPPVIPAYSNLIFDVEILDVTTPPPPAKAPLPGAPVQQPVRK